jgi:hypothetical protein
MNIKRTEWKVANDERLNIDCNFSETSLDIVRVNLGAQRASDLLICCGESTAMDARKLQAVHGFALRVLPDVLLRTAGTWGATFCGRTVWTEGVFYSEVSNPLLDAPDYPS